MKILLIHNQYQHRGGEDTVFESEQKLLSKMGETVDTLLFNNDNIDSTINKIKFGLYSFYNPSSSSLLEEKINSFNPDIVHIHNFFPIASPSIFYVANKKNIPVVMTLHNYRLICPNAMFFREGRVCENCISKSFSLDGVMYGCYRDSKLQTLFLATMTWLHKKNGTWKNRIDKYIALTDFAKNKFLNSSLNLNDFKIEIKPNFVVDYGFELEKEEYCLFVGRLSKEKGIDILLNAFQNSSRKLQIIGSGPMLETVEEYSKKYDNIEYLGFQSIDFIIGKLKKAKALIFTSIWFEGMPMTILESFSTGTPVICGDIGGPAEIVANEINGLVYKAGDSLKLQEKIEKLYTQPELYTTLSQNARMEFEEKYSEEKNYIQLVNIYKKVIDEKK